MVGEREFLIDRAQCLKMGGVKKKWTNLRQTFPEKVLNLLITLVLGEQKVQILKLKIIGSKNVSYRYKNQFYVINIS